MSSFREKLIDMNTRRKTPLKRIRNHCLHCCGFNSTEVARCKSDWCPLHMYRMGTNPSFKGKKGVDSPTKSTLRGTNAEEVIV